MIDFTLDESEKNGVLKIDGSLAVEEAEAFKSAILMAMDRVSHLTIDFSKLTEVSLACLQILCSVHKTASKNGKTVVLGKKTSDVFFKTSKSAGLVRRNNCDHGTRESCFWMRRETS